jgi:FkbM family methyltransferase
MSYLERIGNWLLPGGVLRDFARAHYRHRVNPLYRLVPLIASIEWIEDNVVRVRLRNGVDLCGYADRETRSMFEYADPRRLGPLREFGRCTTFLQILGEEFVDDIYLRGCHLRSGGTVLDLGAHVGAFTVKASRAVGPLGLVVALEPCLPNRQLLDRNVRENGLGNVRIEPKGAWRASAQLPLHVSALSSSHTLIPGSSAVPATGVVENVVVDTVDHILELMAIDRADFVKVDVEGAEIAALEGMSRLLSDAHPALAIASYHVVDGKPSYRSVGPILQTYGYKVTESNGIVYGQ